MPCLRNSPARRSSSKTPKRSRPRSRWSSSIEDYRMRTEVYHLYSFRGFEEGTSPSKHRVNWNLAGDPFSREEGLPVHCHFPGADSISPASLQALSETGLAIAHEVPGQYRGDL